MLLLLLLMMLMLMLLLLLLFLIRTGAMIGLESRNSSHPARAIDNSYGGDNIGRPAPHGRGR